MTKTPGLRAIAIVGWSLFAFWAVVLIAWGVIEPDPYAQGWRLVLWLAFTGRLVNLADGVANGFSTPYLLFQSGLQDIILLLVAYPILIAAYEGRERRGFIGKRIDAIRESAERHKKRVEPWGALGLWVFVFFPFWSTGALVGGMVGYLLGMRTIVVFGSVISGHVLSVLSLVFFFDVMRNVAESFNQGIVKFIPWIVLGILLALAAFGRFGSRPDVPEDAKEESSP